MAAIHAHNAANTSPSSAAVVTPSDSVELTNVTRGLYVGGTGHLNVIMADGQTVLISALPVGAFLPIKVRQVKSTGTTATLIVAFW